MTEYNDLDFIATALDQKGYVVLPNVFEPAFMQEIADELVRVYPWYRALHERLGYIGETEGGAHHILVKKGSFLELLERLPLVESIKRFLNGNVILNSYGAFSNERDSNLYVKNVHRDIRFFDGSAPQMLNILVMLDDFTLENGATYLLPGSHRQGPRPDESAFAAQADRALGKAGSVLLFDSRVWHATGENSTDDRRRALTLTFTRPYYKQQMDYCRLLGYEYCETLSENLKQLLGFNSRVPATLEEWYQPADKRFYKAGQD